MDDFSSKRECFRSDMIWDTQSQLKSSDYPSDDLGKNGTIQAMTWGFLDGIARGFKAYTEKEGPVQEEPIETEETEEVDVNSKTYEKIKEMWKRFGTDTSIHGVKQVGNPHRRKLTRIIWLVLVFISAALLSYNVGYLLYEYHQYKTVTKSDIKIVNTWPFPSVTVCNLCPLVNVDKSPTTALARLIASTSLVGFLVQINYSDPEVEKVLNKSMDFIYKRYSLTPTEFFTAAFYDGERINIEERFEVTETTQGRCFTFNGPKYIEKNNVTMAVREGRHTGLRFYAHINQNKYFVYDDITAGVRLYMTHHPQTPRINEDGIDIHPGTSTSVALNPITYTFLPKPYKSYGDQHCENLHELDIEKRLVNSTFYSYESCLDQCLVYNASDNCSCSVLGYDYGGHPPCNFNQYKTCVRPFLREHRNKLSCDCPRPCRFTDYDVTISSSQMPSRISAPDLFMILNTTSIADMRENYVDVRVFLESRLAKFERHEPQYTLGSILAFLGGQMGFFLGASLITVAELVETFVETVYIVFVDKLLRLGQLNSGSRNNRVQAWN